MLRTKKTPTNQKREINKKMISIIYGPKKL